MKEILNQYGFIEEITDEQFERLIMPCNKGKKKSGKRKGKSKGKRKYN